jgi:hypothetical protein
MALHLHDQCKLALSDKLAYALQDAYVGPGWALKVPVRELVPAEMSIPRNIRQELQRYIGDFPFTTFVAESIDRDLAERHSGYMPQAVPLGDIDGTLMPLLPAQSASIAG